MGKYSLIIVMVSKVHYITIGCSYFYLIETLYKCRKDNKNILIFILDSIMSVYKECFKYRHDHFGERNTKPTSK